ncbi:MAG: mannose-1-phosphate guanylyltransferase [Bacteroidales bacterium]|nr:mannose-1-phosphate guanylyltransferase [Bacteroidales bacterium]MCF8455965.1 mannose-1-phosphate guanylyltransferase [Bacteroidales bacterium]
MDNNNFCVIMAGGIGSRFWPLSKTSKPKQFLDILGTGKTLLRQTFERFSSICPTNNVYVVTSEDYYQLVKDQLPELRDYQILLEPQRCNTAPCIAYANYKILQENPNANIVVAPSDHLILREEEFIRVIGEGLKFVSENEALLTLGIKPGRPETGYGYIQKKEGSTKYPEIKKVKTFTEKPNIEMAKVFFESGEFFWNSGIFLWSLNSIMKSFQQHLPDVNELFDQGIGLYGKPEEKEFILKTYKTCRKISIDYGLMEKADNVYVLTADFGWSDLGTWGSLYEHSHKDEDRNVVIGKNILHYDSKNCMVNVSGKKLVVVQGLNDYIVVESEDKILIIRKQDEQKIKDIVNDIQANIGDHYL